MNDKITLQELIDLFAAKNELVLKDADLFVRTFFELIEEALATEKYIKIKGLGTFKLTEVDSRESINVNTGERIEIQGHTKISFVPDLGLKELINKPFSHFETVILNEGTQLEDTPVITDEEKAAEDEYNATDDKEVASVSAQPAAEEESAAQPMIPTEEPVMADSVQPEAGEPVAVAQDAETEATSSLEAASSPVEPAVAQPAEIGEAQPTEEVVTQPIAAEAVQSEEEPVVPSQTESSVQAVASTQEVLTGDSQESVQNPVQPAASAASQEPAAATRVSVVGPDREVTSQRWKIVSIFLAVVVLIMMVCAYLFYQKVQTDQQRLLEEVKSQLMEMEEKQQEAATAVVSDSIQAVDAAEQAEEPSAKVAEPSAPQKAEKPAQAEQTVKRQKLNPELEYKITGTQSVHRLQPGESLVKIAARYYGTKDLWTYICLHNADVIKDADRVPIGTDLKIPILTPVP